MDHVIVVYCVQGNTIGLISYWSMLLNLSTHHLVKHWDKRVDFGEIQCQIRYLVLTKEKLELNTLQPEMFANCIDKHILICLFFLPMSGILVGWYFKSSSYRIKVLFLKSAWFVRPDNTSRMVIPVCRSGLTNQMQVDTFPACHMPCLARTNQIAETGLSV